ncbi:MAG: metalloregulator ArsR/SmtB family transcription factor [Paracoccaceae bacterium]|jgi:DNA-binding transcriptional ArsR family regulator|nr:metalloregulator ArsR/SmtB family transcription factor [Paracoccaceae bacterium]MDP7185490.1 metalloregulator ArsR/SmtB family transcription factor [Paracoccaceae bacterium]
MPDSLDTTFAALAHPTRRAILAQLAKGPANVNQLAEPFDTSLPAISKHIKVLEDAGLITRGRSAQFRPCILNPQALQAVSDWSEQYRHIWTARFDAMDNALKQMKEREHDG